MRFFQFIVVSLKMQDLGGRIYRLAYNVNWILSLTQGFRSAALMRARIVVHDAKPRLILLIDKRTDIFSSDRFPRDFFFNYTHRTQFIVGGNGEVFILQCTPFLPLLGDPRPSLTAP